MGGLENSLKPMPPGITLWGKISIKLFSWLLVPFVHISPTNVDIILEEEDFSLEEYGISGNVIYTPGHSSGSVSILLDTGEAFVGDAAMNKFPLRLSPGLPIYAEDVGELKKSWEKLLGKNVKTIYPAHGNPFSVDIMREQIP